MECAVCNTPLIEGFLPVTRDKIMWVPKGESVPFWRFTKKKHIIYLTDSPLFSTQNTKGFLCPKCKTITVPVIQELNKHWDL